MMKFDVLCREYGTLSLFSIGPIGMPQAKAAAEIGGSS
jgi:hypothetical protein